LAASPATLLAGLLRCFFVGAVNGLGHVSLIQTERAAVKGRSLDGEFGNERKRLGGCFGIYWIGCTCDGRSLDETKANGVGGSASGCFRNQRVDSGAAGAFLGVSVGS